MGLGRATVTVRFFSECPLSTHCGHSARNALEAHSNSVHRTLFFEDSRGAVELDEQVPMFNPFHFCPRPAPSSHLLGMISDEDVSPALGGLTSTDDRNLCREASRRSAITLEEDSLVGSIRRGG